MFTLIAVLTMTRQPLLLCPKPVKTPPSAPPLIPPLQSASYGLLSPEENAFRFQRYSGGMRWRVVCVWWWWGGCLDGFTAPDAAPAACACWLAGWLADAALLGTPPIHPIADLHFTSTRSTSPALAPSPFVSCPADEESVGGGEGAAGHTRAPAQTSGAHAGGGHGDGHGEEFDFGEVMVHQVRAGQGVWWCTGQLQLWAWVGGSLMRLRVAGLR
jgi:hypothetical protein